MTDDEKAAVLAAVLDLYRREGPWSGRGYTYKLGRLGEQGDIFWKRVRCGTQH